MPASTRADRGDAAADTRAVYSATARGLHWLTVVLVAVLLPVGIVMHNRGSERNIWDALTNTLYSGHKLMGFVLLWIVVARLAYRLMHGAPPDAANLARWQKVISHLTHWALYGLLIAIPLTGWLGVSLFPALDVFGLFSLPALTAPDQELSKTAFGVHEILGKLLMLLIALHVAAALFHHFMVRDNVLARMWPALWRNGDTADERRADERRADKGRVGA